MRRFEKLLMALGAALVLVLAGPATAQLATNSTQVGSAFAAPYVTAPGAGGSAVVTAIVVTNASDMPTVLQLHIINGDENEDWNERSINCRLTGNETTLIVIEPDGVSDADLDMECSEATATPGSGNKSIIEERSLPGARGIVFVAQSEGVTPASATIRNDVLIADWTIFDFEAGEAYSAEALHFQRGTSNCNMPADPCVESDKAFQFDTFEYTAFPSSVASNFIAPDCIDPADPSTCDVDVEVLLFTLDGRAGDPPPAEARLDFYNDDERLLDNVDIPFECLDILRLVDLDEDFNAVDLCEVAPLGCVGHFVLTPQRVDVFTGHDNPTGFGDAFNDNERLSVFHGWIIHRFAEGATVLTFDGPAGTGMAGDASTARLLLSGANNNTGLEAGDGDAEKDTPTYDAR